MRFVNRRFPGLLGGMKAATVALICLIGINSGAHASEAGRDGFWYSKKYMTTPSVTQSIVGSHQIRFDLGRKVEPKKQGLNLLSGKLTQKPRRVSYDVIARGSYVCSPAGFGRRSTCRRN